MKSTVFDLTGGEGGGADIQRGIHRLRPTAYHSTQCISSKGDYLALKEHFTIMHLSLLSLPLFLSIVSATYENTLVSRNYELGGSISSITTTYNIKYTQEGTRSVEHAEDYELVIGSEGEEESAWWDISVGGKRLEGLVVRDAGVEGR